MEDFVENQLLFSLAEDWTPAGQTSTYKQGTVIALKVKEAEKDVVRLKPTVLFAPTAREFAQQVTATRNCVLVTTLDHVQGRAYTYSYGRNGNWTGKQLPVPDNQSIFIATTNWSDDRFFMAETGFLTPNSAWLVERRSRAA
jgi:prolyl oligopeptidase